MKYNYLGFTRFISDGVINFEIFFFSVIDNHEKTIKVKINSDKWGALLQVLNKYLVWLNLE